MWHVYPLDDLREHVTDTAEGTCWCNPTEDEDLLIHHSMDGREAFETGERQPS